MNEKETCEKGKHSMSQKSTELIQRKGCGEGYTLNLLQQVIIPGCCAIKRPVAAGVIKSISLIVPLQ